MVDEDRYCIDVLTQISAIQAALDKVALGLLDDHARHCLLEGHGGPEGAADQADELMSAVGRLHAPGIIVEPSTAAADIPSRSTRHRSLIDGLASGRRPLSIESTREPSRT